MKTESKLAAFLRRQRDGVRFCALFAVFTVLVFAVLYTAQHALVDPLNHHFAWITQTALRLVGVQAFSSGPIVTLSSFAVEIKTTGTRSSSGRSPTRCRCGTPRRIMGCHSWPPSSWQRRPGGGASERRHWCSAWG